MRDTRADESSAWPELKSLFHPRSIAIVGASTDPLRIGGRPLSYLSRAGYEGEVVGVNPRYKEVAGRVCYPTVDDLPNPVDLALVAVGGERAIEAIEACRRRGISNAVVFASGFSEAGIEGEALQRRLKEAAVAGDVRMLGPNSLGIVTPADHFIGSFATAFEQSDEIIQGHASFVSQSGALGAFIFSAAQRDGIGFRYWVSTGNEAGLVFSDFVAFMASDPETSVIAGYLEGVTDGRRLEAALRLARDAGKEVCLLKVGRSDIGRSAVRSHTAALAGSDAVYESLFEEYGVVRVLDPQGLVDYIRLASHRRQTTEREVAIVTISGGVGAWMSDAFADHGVPLASLDDAVRNELAEVLPSFARNENPVDFTGQVLNEPGLLRRCLDTILEQAGLGVLVVSLGLQDEHGERFARGIVEATHEARLRERHVDCVVAWMAAPAGALEILRSAGIPTFVDFGRCVDAVAALVRPRVGLSSELARAETEGPLIPPGAEVLDEIESKDLMAKWGIAVPLGRIVSDGDDAVAAAAALGLPVVIKGISSDHPHKTELGLVRVGLQDDAAVRTAVDEILDTLEGIGGGRILVEQMVPGGLEVLVGLTNDEAFGPVLVVGSGGVLAEVIEDRALRLVPVGTDEASQMIDSTRVGRLVGGFRGSASADRYALVEIICRLSDFAQANDGRFESVDLNPVIVGPNGAVAADALIVCASSREASEE